MRGGGRGPRSGGAETPAPLSRLRERAAVVGLLLAAALLAGCNPFDIGPPDQARVILGGPDGATVRLVTSNHVLRSLSEDGDEVIEVIEADTSVVALPFNREYSIQPRKGQYNFYARTAAPDSQSVIVRMQVLVGGETFYDQEWDVGEQPHDFLYLR